MRRKRRSPAPGPPAGDLDLVADFVNSWDAVKKTETWTSPAELAHWLERRRLVEDAGELGPAELKRALMIRRGLRALIIANSGGDLDAKAVAALDQAARGVSCGARFEDDGEMGLAAGEESFDGALGLICCTAVLARGEGRWRRMKICRNPSCWRAFYDASATCRSPCCTDQCRDSVHSWNYRRRYRKRYGRMPYS